MVCLGFVGCPHHTVGSYLVLALSMLCVIICIRIILYVLSKVCCGNNRETTMTGITERDIREVREIRDRAATEAMMQLVFRLYPPWLTHPPAQPEIPNADPGVTDEWDSKLVISAGGDRVSCIARPCPLNIPIEERK